MRRQVRRLIPKYREKIELVAWVLLEHAKLAAADIDELIGRQRA
jgi:hypothetical protein